MTSYIFLFLLHFTSFYFSSGNHLDSYGLAELTRDILEKIKAATGQPIDTNYFIPILAESTKGYEVFEEEPYSKTTKFSKASNDKKLDGGFFHSRKNKKGLKQEKDHFYEVAESGEEGQDSVKQKYGDHIGKKHKYNEGRFFSKNHHKTHGGKKGGKSKKGRKHGKFHIEKGFRDIYHKDEEKKSDYFWNNKHEEGKWIQYGLKNRKTSKSHDKGDEGKQQKSKTDESSYEKKEKKCTKCKTH